jgi:hypothetical protein
MNKKQYISEIKELYNSINSTITLNKDNKTLKIPLIATINDFIKKDLFIYNNNKIYRLYTINSLINIHKMLKLYNMKLKILTAKNNLTYIDYSNIKNLIFEKYMNSDIYNNKLTITDIIMLNTEINENYIKRYNTKFDNTEIEKKILISIKTFYEIDNIIYAYKYIKFSDKTEKTIDMIDCII